MILPFTLAWKSKLKLRNFLVGSAHVRSQATVHAFMHAAHAVCMRAEDIDTRFQRARVASSPEVPKVTWWKIATFLGYHLHWLTSLETSRHFRKIALRLGIFLAMFRECLCVVARQLAPKCSDFSNVAKLARQCKWPYSISWKVILSKHLIENSSGQEQYDLPEPKGQDSLAMATLKNYAILNVLRPRYCQAPWYCWIKMVTE